MLRPTLLHPADPAALDARRDAITVMGESINDPDLFRDAKEACLKRRAFLFVSPEAFFVLKLSAQMGVWVWVAQTDRPVNRKEYLAELVRLATEIGAHYIGFGSDRPGFHRIAPQFGFVPEKSTWNGVPITNWRKLLEY